MVTKVDHVFWLADLVVSKAVTSGGFLYEAVADDLSILACSYLFIRLVARKRERWDR